ncbi:MAG: hypothetical protein ACE5HE_03240, partial [Phycisphaerae bacterium]
VEDRDEMRALEVYAVAYAAKLDIGVLFEVLESDLTATVAHRVVDFTEASTTDGTLDRELV